MNHQLVFTAHDRPFYFQPAIDSWTFARGFHDWKPTVFLEPGRQEHRMRAIATRAGATVSVNLRHRGVLSNPWHALDTAFTAGADFVVLAEDDVIVSDDTLEYFTWAAADLRDKHILAVCACSTRPDCGDADTQLVVTDQIFNPLVWGTWAQRWTTVLRDTWDHDYSSGTPEAPQCGWDWNINLRIMKDWRIAKPLTSRSNHIGQYGGTHMQPADFHASVSPTFRDRRPAAPYRLVSDR